MLQVLENLACSEGIQNHVIVLCRTQYIGTRKSPEQKGVCRFLSVQQNIYECHHFGGLGSEQLKFRITCYLRQLTAVPTKMCFIFLI